MVTKYAKAIDMKRKMFESREVYKPSELTIAKLSPTGYEAIRISPKITMKFGRKYRRLYGASVSPNFRGKKINGKYGAKIEWYPHGYTYASVKPGTKMLTSLRTYPVNQVEAKRKLMVKTKRRKK